MEKDQLLISATQLLFKLKELEVRLGNFIEPTKDHTKHDLQLLTQNINFEPEELSEENSELLFAQIVNLLDKAGYEPNKIVDLINAGFKPYSRLPYCDEKEVTEVLQN